MPGALTVRALTSTDLDAFASEFARAVESHEMRASSDPEGSFVMKVVAVDPTQFVGAFDGPELVGYASSEFKITIVRPAWRRRGIGRTLVDAAEGRARSKGHAELLMGVVPGEPIGPLFLGALGFTYHSTVWDLDLPSDDPVPAPVWPEGHIGRSFDRNRDLESWIRVFNAAFADHPTPLQLDPKQIGGALADPDNEDGDIVLVEEAASGEIVGFCATEPSRRGGAVGDHGELWAIGVRPDRQGRGLGRQLVRAGVERLRGIGVPNVSLAVNGRNESALGLYESEGFVRVRTRDRWARPVSPGDPGPESGT
jgi:mycothiol synthase